MQISCERCATVYVLDDKLIPQGGASVQCTRCGHVFTARPTAPVAARAPVSAEVGWGPASPPARDITGSGSAEAASNRTLIDFTPPSARTGAPPATGQPSPVAGGASASHATQMFGTRGSEASPFAASNATQMFGGPVAAAPAPREDSGATQKVPVGGAGSHATQMFGSSPFAAPSPAHGTQMFGAPPAAAPAPVPAHGTQMFGAPPAAALAPVPAHGTQMFGAPPAVAPAPVPAHGVPMFGAPAAASTLMFGAAGPVPPAPVPLAVHSEGALVGTTAPNGSIDRTMAYGAAGGPQGAVRRSGPVPQQAPLTGQGPVRRSGPVAPVSTPASEVSALESSATVLKDLGATGAVRAKAGDGGGEAAETADTSPSVRAVEVRPTRSPTHALARRSPAPMVAGAQTMELQLALKKNQRRLPLLLGVGAFILVAGGGTALYVKSLPPRIDLAVAAAHGDALVAIKRDDEASLKKALADLEALSARVPKFVPAQADQIIANLFLARDLRDEIERLQTRYFAADKERGKLEEKKEGADWAARAVARRDEMAKLKDKIEPLQNAARKHDERAGALLKSTQALVKDQQYDSGALFRAWAIYEAVKGSEKAEKVADFYRKNMDERKVLHDDGRAWADLALAALVAQPRLSAERKVKGLSAVEAVFKKDPALLAAKLYQAKIFLASKDFPRAKAALDELIAANPRHEAAARLKADVEEAAKAPPAPEPAGAPESPKK